MNPPTGCRFHPRCPLRAQLGDPAICATDTPALLDVGGEHWCACHFRMPGADPAHAPELEPTSPTPAPAHAPASHATPSGDAAPAAPDHPS